MPTRPLVNGRSGASALTISRRCWRTESSSAAGDERLDLADEPLERLGVVWRRLFRDHCREAQLEEWPEPLSEFLGRPIPERVVVRDALERGPVRLDRGTPHALGLVGGVADRELHAECELD